MLIVNADDWGYDQATTDAIADVYRAGRVTSATAMVNMQDSRRAAKLAGVSSIPLGLHLNLMEPYSDVLASPDVRHRQEWIVSRYRGGQLLRWMPSRGLFAHVCQCVDDQLEAFAQLYGVAPTHVDGHQHGHMSTAALWALARRGERVIRRSFTFRSTDKSAFNRVSRFMLNGFISARFLSTERFHSIRDLHPRLGGHGLDVVISEAHRRDVEIMVHPGIADEHEILMSSEWGRLLAGAPLGSYRDLRVDHGS
jgi:predicted glycoside hydrolase/deacetylase ChbG (UPF0249 family)